MYHLRKFQNNAEYREYLKSDDQWRPIVAYIKNTHDEVIDPVTHKDINMELSDWSTENDRTARPYLGGGGETPNPKRWVDFRDLGEKFIEVYNDGQMYFTDFRGTDKGDFYATVDQSTGVLDIHVPTDTHPDAGGDWVTIDESTGLVSFVNYPEEPTD